MEHHHADEHRPGPWRIADSSSWNDVADRLIDDGHHVIAYANPLRSVASDAAGLNELVRTLNGQVVLVGHSY
jgi:hypothetical protein